MDSQEKILIPLLDDDIAPRFDLVQEVAIVVRDRDQKVLERKILVLAEASAESLCQLILNEKIDTVICCGIEDEYYQYLTWKKVKVLDHLTGSFEAAIAHAGKNSSPEVEIFLEA